MTCVLIKSRYIFTKYVTLEKNLRISRNLISPIQIHSFFHTGKSLSSQSNKAQKEVVSYAFENVKDKRKEAYLDILRTYVKHERKSGHTEFIQLALKYMEMYGVHKDLETYKTLLDIFPKGKYIPTNKYAAMFMYYPLQQQVAVDVLAQMEYHSVIPDRDMEELLLNIFGRHARPLKRYWRMMYWMPKFAHLNPWAIPNPIPTDPRILAKFAVEKISSVDVLSNITEYKTKDIKDSNEDTWILSAMSESQKELLLEHFQLRKEKPLFVEGPFIIWVANKRMDYFVLRADPIKREEIEIDIDDVSNIKIPFWEEIQKERPLTIHEQEDGVYLATCVTGTSSKDSVVSWVRCLEKDNPALANIPIVIKLSSLASSMTYIEEKQNVEPEMIT